MDATPDQQGDWDDILRPYCQFSGASARADSNETEGSDFTLDQIAMMRLNYQETAPLPQGVTDVGWEAPKVAGLDHSTAIFGITKTSDGRLSRSNINLDQEHFRSWQVENGVARTFSSHKVEKVVDGKVMTVMIGDASPSSSRGHLDTEDALRVSSRAERDDDTGQDTQALPFDASGAGLESHDVHEEFPPTQSVAEDVNSPPVDTPSDDLSEGHEGPHQKISVVRPPLSAVGEPTQHTAPSPPPSANSAGNFCMKNARPGRTLTAKGERTVFQIVRTVRRPFVS